MKKAKIMLMAIAVLAIAGGALAFKARTASVERICLRTDPDKIQCDIYTSSIVDHNVGVLAWYTTEPGITTTEECLQLTCPNPELYKFDQ
jgi:hypothetical protein